MAWNYYGKKKGYGKRKGYSKKKSKYTEVEKMAYMMGRVERGRNNPNSRITDSYNNGLKEPVVKVKKPLF